jgi:hypothetical protein
MFLSSCDTRSVVVVVLLRQPFQVVGSVVGLHFVDVVHGHTVGIAFAKVECHKSVYHFRYLLALMV